MHWEEKIERLKKQFSAEEFKLPFTAWRGVFRKIEERHVAKGAPGFEAADWFPRVKGRQPLRTILANGIEEELDHLDPRQNYWVVLMHPLVEGKRLYDCRLSAMKALCRMWQGDFYVVDKKYAWMACFRRDGEDVGLHRSGAGATPFEG